MNKTSKCYLWFSCSLEIHHCTSVLRSQKPKHWYEKPIMKHQELLQSPKNPTETQKHTDVDECVSTFPTNKNRMKTWYFAFFDFSFPVDSELSLVEPHNCWLHITQGACMWKPDTARAPQNDIKRQVSLTLHCSGPPWPTAHLESSGTAVYI